MASNGKFPDDLSDAAIDQWSLGLDFKILAKTIPAVLRGAGAA
jgi:lipopolysaccharide/colanic/teichoic acid biosynthesis glycosyltransferase